jgi:PAS domain S-box-containing protein
MAEPDRTQRAEESTRTTQAQLRAFIRQAPVSIAMFDRQMNYLATSGRWVSDWGGGLAELVGRNHYEVYPDVPEWWRRVHCQGQAGASIEKDDEVWVRADGSKHWLHWAVQPWFDDEGEIGGIIISTQDITDRKRAEEGLRESEQRYAAIFEHSPFGITLTRVRDQVVIGVNDAFLRLCERRREEVLGRTSSELPIPDPEAQARARAELSRRGTVRDFECTHTSRGGARRDLSLDIDAVSVGGEPHVLTTIRDVTERKQAAETARLYQTTKEISELKTQLFASVSHELRTPLALILGPTERLLATPETPEAVRRDLEVIARNARTLLRHVDDLMDVSKLEANRMNMERVDTDLSRLARFVASHFEVLAQEKRLAHTLDVPEGIHAVVDPDKMRRVLLNLLSNAFKFTPNGGRVRLGLRAAGGRVTIEVADSGPGIPEDLRAAVFERFRQIGRGPGRRHGGMGLGLSIVHDFVALHGGTTSVTQAPEGGALFVVDLPLVAPPGGAAPGIAAEASLVEEAEARQAAEELRGAPSPPRSPQGAPGGALILVVEDNPEMNRFICEGLAPDHRVAPAIDGEEALRRAIELGPELIVTDIMMPGMGGDELVRAVRARGELDRTPIVLLTARADDDLRIRLLREGAQDYLTKPFAIEELRTRIDNLIAARRSEAEQRFLAEVGSIVATTLDYEETLGNVANAIVGELADLCILETADEGERVHRLKVAHRDPTAAAAARAMQDVELDARRPHLGSGALETRQPLLMRHVGPEYIASITQSEEHRRALHELGPRSLMALPLVAYGRLVGALILVRTTPDRQYTPRDLPLAEKVAGRAALAVENARLYRIAQQAIAARDDVLSVVAHDLRNPLSNVLGGAALLRQRGPAPELTRTLAEAIERSARRMSRLIQDLLDVTRMEAGRLSVEQARVPAAELLAETLQTQRPFASSASLGLGLDVAGDLPEIWADRDRVLQVFENLVGNAVKFTAPGGDIVVGARPKDSEVLFWVADTGAGIAVEDLPHVFERFWQAQRGDRRGAGLGLQIVKGIVEAHGGRIWVESTPSRGSRFLFTIPRAP